MTENDYIAEYVRERHPGILNLDYAVWRFMRAICEFGVSMKEAISRLSAEDLRKMAEEQGVQIPQEETEDLIESEEEA